MPKSEIIIPDSLQNEIRRSLKSIDNENLKNQIRELQNTLNYTRFDLPDMSPYITQFNESIKKISIMPEKFQESIKEYLSSVENVFIDLSTSFDDLSIYYNNSLKNSFITDGTTEITLGQSSDVVVLKRMFSDISFRECGDFLNFIANYPMLSYQNEIGIRVFELVRDAEKQTINHISIYRVRKHEFNKKLPYTDNEMFEPPYKTTQQHRFSSSGQNYLYTSDNLETAIKEVGIVHNDKYTWIKLELIRDMSFFNICNRSIPLFEYCHYQSVGETQLSTEYLLPNYLADCAKANNFDGIIYKSIMDEETTNYVFFQAGKRDFVIIERGTE